MCNLMIFKAYSIFGFASKNLFSSYKELGSNICPAIPTSVETIGVLVIAHSITAAGPPSTLDDTMYRFKQLYNSLIV